MICAIGIDAVEIHRFAVWTTYPRTRLARIFSETELEYSFSVPACTAQRLAVRFAAREAFFKALCVFDQQHTVPFLSVCRYVSVERTASGAITLSVDWVSLRRTGLTTQVKPIVHLSATHTASTAFVTVIFETF